MTRLHYVWTCVTMVKAIVVVTLVNLWRSVSGTNLYLPVIEWI